MNITKELEKLTTKDEESYSQNQAVKTVLMLEDKNAQEDMRLAKALGGSNSIMRALDDKGKKMQIEDLRGKYKGDVFTYNQIKDIARRYNLRFLKSQNYCGTIPVETLSKLKAFGKDTSTELSDGNINGNFFILAPEKCFNLEKVKKMRRDPDPALFYKIDDDHYRMVHQWGSDFTILNRIAGFFWESRSKMFISFMVMLWSVMFAAIHFTSAAWGLYFVGLAPTIFLFVLSYNDNGIMDNGDFHDGKWRSTSKIYG